MAVQTSSSGYWVNQVDAIWNVAGTTSTPAYETWQSSNISWRNGEEYTFIARAIDAAGNHSFHSTTTFKYDSSAPVTAVTRPADGGTYSAQLTVISGTTRDEPDTGGRQAGIELFKVGIQRQSDSKWWNGNALGWQVGRVDVAHAAPGGLEWQHLDMGGFWNGVPTAETFSL